MSQEKHIGLDVHQATNSAAVMDASGELLMECLLETRRPQYGKNLRRAALLG